MKTILLRSTLFAAVALLSAQMAFAQNAASSAKRAMSTSARKISSAATNLKAATTHPSAKVPGDGLDGVGYGHDYMYTHGGPDVGYNYYGHPGTGAESSGMYPAPYPTHPVTGSSMYTYQPLMPHEHMYQHHRTYYTPYAGADAFYTDPYGRPRGGGYNKTDVTWQTGCHHFAPSPIGYYGLHELQMKLNRLKYLIPKIGCTNGNCQ